MFLLRCVISYFGNLFFWFCLAQLLFGLSTWISLAIDSLLLQMYFSFLHMYSHFGIQYFSVWHDSRLAKYLHFPRNWFPLGEDVTEIERPEYIPVHRNNQHTNAHKIEIQINDNQTFQLNLITWGWLQPKALQTHCSHPHSPLRWLRWLPGWWWWQWRWWRGSLS